MAAAREDGRIVVITGAAGGIGKLAVECFLANSDTVIASDTSQDALDKLAPADRLRTVVADISQEKDCLRIAAAAGVRVDVLINVAGFFPMQPFDEMSADDFRKVVDINLTGTFLMIKAIAPLMRGRGWGRIVNIGSASVFEGVADQVHYVAAKAGLFGLSRSLARVFGEDGITVNVVTPGLTTTPKVKAHLPADLIEQQIKLRAIQREEKGEDLIGAIFFLASPYADFISGQTVNVDGGKHML